MHIESLHVPTHAEHPRRQRILRIAFCLAISLGSTSACGGASKPPALTPAAFDDAALAARVRTTLVNDAVLGLCGIDVQVQQSRVTLTGRIETESERQRAIALIAAVPGVKDVRWAQVEVGRLDD